MHAEPKAMISPHFSAEKLSDPTVEDLVDIFEDRVKFWLLAPAGDLMARSASQVAGFGMLLSYFLDLRYGHR